MCKTIAERVTAYCTPDRANGELCNVIKVSSFLFKKFSFDSNFLKSLSVNARKAKR